MASRWTKSPFSSLRRTLRGSVGQGGTSFISRWAAGGRLTEMATMYAPAERAAPEDVQRQHDKLATLPFVRAFLGSAPTVRR